MATRLCWRPSSCPLARPEMCSDASGSSSSASRYTRCRLSGAASPAPERNSSSREPWKVSAARSSSPLRSRSSQSTSRSGNAVPRSDFGRRQARSPARSGPWRAAGSWTRSPGAGRCSLPFPSVWPVSSWRGVACRNQRTAKRAIWTGQAGFSWRGALAASPIPSPPTPKERRWSSGSPVRLGYSRWLLSSGGKPEPANR